MSNICHNKSDNNIRQSSISPSHMKKSDLSPTQGTHLSKFPELENNYNLITSEIKNKDFLSRPLKLT